MHFFSFALTKAKIVCTVGPIIRAQIEAKSFARGGGGEIFRGKYMSQAIAAKKVSNWRRVRVRLRVGGT